MDSLIRWSLSRRVVVAVSSSLLLVVGLWVATRLPIDVFPDLTAPTVTVITEAHGMAPVDVEAQVTFPLESVMNGAYGVRRVRSETSTGVSIVWIEFQWDVDIRVARQVVNERVSLVTPMLPADVSPPFLAPVSSIMGEILFLGVTSDHPDEIALRTWSDAVLRRRLLAVPGVAQVNVLGGSRKQFQAVVDPLRLIAHGVSVPEVAEALRRANENTTAGWTNDAGSRYLVVGSGRIQTLDDVERTVVRSRDNVPLTVGDLGEARIGGAPKVGDGAVDAAPAVIVSVQKQPGADTIALTERIDDVLHGLQGSLPPGVRIARDLFRQRDFIDVAVRNVFHALRDGGILVVVIMAVFLASWRATVITLTAIPLSLCAAVLILLAWGATINTMTLGGMAIAIGALVDDAVIDVENVTRRLRQNATRPREERRRIFRVVLEASVEIRSSITFATLVVILVFVPIFFLSGIEGRLLAPLGLAYVVSLVASLIVALTLTPVLCYWLLPRAAERDGGEEPRFARALKTAYNRALRPVLDHPWIALAPAALGLVVAIAASFLWGRSFLPDFNEGNLTITAMTLPGTPLESSSSLGRAVEEVLLEHEEVVSTARRTGRSEGDEHAQGAESTEIEVVLRETDRSKDDFLAALRARLAFVPGVSVTIGQPISHRIDHMLSGTEASIAVKIFGPDLYRLRELASEVEHAMASVDGIVDLRSEQQTDVPLLRIRHDRDAQARYGVSVHEVSDTLEAAFSGLRASTIIEESRSYDLSVLLQSDEQTWDVRSAREIPVEAGRYGPVPLGALAQVEKDLGPNRISREAATRKIVVQANVAGRDVVSVVEDVRAAVDPILAESPDYRVEYGGQFESARSATRRLAALTVAVVLGIAGLLHFAFGNVRDALFVMTNLPLALIGAVAGVFLTGGTLSIASLIGFITVFGIATRNGILLVSHFRHLQLEEGETDLREAIHRGATERLLPVLMTALGTALALAPLAIAGDRPGNEIQAPMAVVILTGLCSSTLLNMLVVPALYSMWGRPAAPPDDRAPEERAT